MLETFLVVVALGEGRCVIQTALSSRSVGVGHGCVVLPAPLVGVVHGFVVGGRREHVRLNRLLSLRPSLAREV